MLIWLLAVVLIGAFAALGFQTGGIRAAVSLVGVVLGLVFASTVGNLVAPIFPTIGISSLSWRITAAPVAGFLIVWLPFFGVGFAAHRPVYLHFKYREEDSVRIAFERMNSALGLFVGLVAGISIFLFAGRPIYSLGYLTTQTAAEAGEPAPVGYLNQLRNGMNETGWDKTFAALDRTPAQQYAVDDIIGLLEANPLVHARAQTYPEFLALVERSEFTDLANDADYQKLLQDRAGFTALFENPRTQSFLSNAEILEKLAKLDLKDFRQYLESGKSAKYDDEHILGRWRCDISSTIIDARRRRTNLQPADLLNLRFVLNTFFKKATLTAYPDGRLVVKVPAPEKAAAATAAAAADSTPGVDPNLARRYGARYAQQVAQNRGGQGATPAAAAAPQRDPAKLAAKIFPKLASGDSADLSSISGEGTWTRVADKYLISAKPGGADAHESSISDAGRLAIPLPELQLTLFFVRAI
jgi:hypothetical protein